MERVHSWRPRTMRSGPTEIPWRRHNRPREMHTAQNFNCDARRPPFFDPTAPPVEQQSATMSAALNKIAPNSPSRQSPSEIETSIANALYDLEQNIPDMKASLRPLQFVSAREVR